MTTEPILWQLTNSIHWFKQWDVVKRSWKVAILCSLWKKNMDNLRKAHNDFFYNEVLGNLLDLIEKPNPFAEKVC